MVDHQIKDFYEAWNRDTDQIGRLLRAHLVLEHFISQYLRWANPRLGSLERARLTFAQKVELLDATDLTVGMILPGLQCINQLRNKAAHKLTLSLELSDMEPILKLPEYGALREELAKPAKPSSHPLDILEDFTRFASYLLQAQSSGTAELWRRAYDAESST